MSIQIVVYEVGIQILSLC